MRDVTDRCPISLEGRNKWYATGLVVHSVGEGGGGGGEAGGHTVVDWTGTKRPKLSREAGSWSAANEGWPEESVIGQDLTFISRTRKKKQKGKKKKKKRGGKSEKSVSKRSLQEGYARPVGVYLLGGGGERCACASTWG